MLLAPSPGSHGHSSRRGRRLKRRLPPLHTDEDLATASELEHLPKTCAEGRPVPHRPAAPRPLAALAPRPPPSLELAEGIYGGRSPPPPARRLRLPPKPLRDHVANAGVAAEAEASSILPPGASREFQRSVSAARSVGSDGSDSNDAAIAAALVDDFIEGSDDDGVVLIEWINDDSPAAAGEGSAGMHSVQFLAAAASLSPPSLPKVPTGSPMSSPSIVGAQPVAPAGLPPPRAGMQASPPRGARNSRGRPQRLELLDRRVPISAR